MMKRHILTGFILIMSTLVAAVSCDSLLGSKGDKTTDEIFEEGRIDPDDTDNTIGYAAILPFWDFFDAPTDVYVGFDELVYVTDAVGLHVLDRAGRLEKTIPIEGGAFAVTQDRLLNVYVAARYDTVITAVDPNITWNLAAVYKFKNANGAGELQTVQVLKHPFMDASRSTAFSQRVRLNRNLADNDELVEITGIAVLANNDIYLTRRGPRNSEGQAVAPDNTVLTFTENRDSNGNRLGTMRNTGQLRILNPNTPSMRSGISINDITTFIGPPQRENMSSELSFVIAQGDETRNIPIRVLWIDVVDTPDGLEYRPKSSLLVQDTTRADSFLYSQNKFRNPSGLAYSADERSQIFVVDSATDSLYVFQSTGLEGINTPGQRKVTNVSFGGTGNGARQFNNPSGVAYFRVGRIVYVADTGNNRISRFKLNTDIDRD
jgi:hypothetical protein